MKSFIVAALASVAYADDAYTAPQTCEEWKAYQSQTFNCTADWTVCTYENKDDMFYELIADIAKDMQIGGVWYNYSPCGTKWDEFDDFIAGLDGLTVTQTALRKGLAKKLIKRRQEMIDTWDATWDAYPIIDAPTTTDMGGEMPDIDRYMSGECWWDENSYSYVCEDDKLGPKIRDALESVWDRYADHEAVEAWLESTQATADEMSQRHQEEGQAFAEQVAADVKDAMEGVLHEMVTDLNEQMEQALSDFEAQEDEALLHFDDQDITMQDWEMKRVMHLAKKAQETETANQYYGGFAAGALVGGAATAIALFYVKKQQKNASEDAFQRV